MNDMVRLLSEYQFQQDRQSDLLIAFQELDHDADGYIPENDLVQFVTTMGEALEKNEVNYMLQMAKDEDHEERTLVNIKRLAQLMLPSDDILDDLKKKANAMI